MIWLSYDRAWGGSFDTIYKQQFVDNFALNEFELQPIKFQGQSLDTETGLHTTDLDTMIVMWGCLLAVTRLGY